MMNNQVIPRSMNRAADAAKAIILILMLKFLINNINIVPFVIGIARLGERPCSARLYLQLADKIEVAVIYKLVAV